MKKSIFLVLLIALNFIYAQDVPKNGISTPDENYILFKNAVIHVDGNKTVKGSLLLLNDKIVAVGMIPFSPKYKVVHDLKGRHIYASFVEPYSHAGQAKVTPKRSYRPQIMTLKSGPYYWNEAVQPELNGYERFNLSNKEATKLRKAGFGTLVSHQNVGVISGSSTAYALQGDATSYKVLSDKTSLNIRFSSYPSQQTYPSSQMGSIALIRQAFYDAAFYNRSNIAYSASLQALVDKQQLPTVFYAKDKLEVSRYSKIAKEFGLNAIVFGSGYEYERIDEISKDSVALILPLNYPKAYKTDDPFVNRTLSLRDLKRWEQAPSNAKIVADAGIPFAFSAYGLKDVKEYYKAVEKAVQRGLSFEDAVNAMTLNPAQFLGLDKEVGSLEKGKRANFIITNQPMFSKGFRILENWTNGDRLVMNDATLSEISGVYAINVEDLVMDLKISGDTYKPSVKLTYKEDTLVKEVKVAFQRIGRKIEFEFEHPISKDWIQMIGNYTEKFGTFDGVAQKNYDTWFNWSAVRNSEVKTKVVEFVSQDSTALNVSFPNMAYGFETLPSTGSVLLKNATVWTNTEKGILRNSTVLIVDGKIKSVGKMNGLIPRDALVIDCTNKHITTGIVDEHSHIAISKGVNESGQSITAEVSIGDVVRSDDINIYRQLAGGVTTSQLLHGSANPIGGQSALIKLKWGYAPEEMLIPNAPGFIKFALGENVKQTNWGENYTERYPQTRMGVKQMMKNAFLRALEYEKEWKAYETGEDTSSIQPRRDLELEVVLEIIKGKRFVTCHSYQQGEMLMLMDLAEEFGFRINTFTHVLEGYKIADRLREHGAAASTFSDWWAYKYEVNDAIPYNGAILAKTGVLTAYNSDDAEMGRRLNQEAAKAIKYGGLPAEEAWKLITLNPAKMLHLDDRIGMIKEGYDGDVVVWSTSPLSISATVQQTFIDGQLMYDRMRSVDLKYTAQKERARIIKLMKNSKEKKVDYAPVKQRLYHCETIGQ